MRAKEFLIEARDYSDMFNRVIRLVFPQPEKQERAKIMYKHTADNARKILKRSDRIIWYIQQVKLDLMFKNLNNTESVSSEQLQKEFDQLRKKYPFDQPVPNGLIYTLEHYLSLPIPTIQNYEFGNQTVETVLDDFANAESEWQKSLKGTVTAESDDKKLIDLGDYSWWLLPRGSCSKEGEAMGHCGNVPSEQQGDRILSLRSESNGKLKPHLTFILKQNGYLSEMKGRGNQKPAKKYHDAIIQLLEHDIVKGIGGGGYLPENNFSVNDLNTDQQSRLFDTKPSVCPLNLQFELDENKAIEYLENHLNVYTTNNGDWCELDIMDLTTWSTYWNKNKNMDSWFELFSDLLMLSGYPRKGSDCKFQLINELVNEQLQTLTNDDYAAFVNKDYKMVTLAHMDKVIEYAKKIEYDIDGLLKKLLKKFQIESIDVDAESLLNDIDPDDIKDCERHKGS